MTENDTDKLVVEERMECRVSIIYTTPELNIEKKVQEMYSIGNPGDGTMELYYW